MVDELLAGNALHNLRSAQGVLSLADRHEPERLEATIPGTPEHDDEMAALEAAGTQPKASG